MHRNLTSFKTKVEDDVHALTPIPFDFGFTAKLFHRVDQCFICATSAAAS